MKGVFKAIHPEVASGDRSSCICRGYPLPPPDKTTVAVSMPDVHRVGDLELEQDVQYQQRSWAFERIGWIAMSLIAIAALLGLTGSGW
jgi:hypothetical protein